MWRLNCTVTCESKAQAVELWSVNADAPSPVPWEYTDTAAFSCIVQDERPPPVHCCLAGKLRPGEWTRETGKGSGKTWGPAKETVWIIKGQKDIQEVLGPWKPGRREVQGAGNSPWEEGERRTQDRPQTWQADGRGC